MITTTSRPSIDPELATLLAPLPPNSTLDDDLLQQVRPYSSAPVEPVLEGRSIERTEFTATAEDGAEIALSVFRPTGRRTEAAPCIYWVHGGGMVMGDRFANVDIPWNGSTDSALPSSPSSTGWPRSRRLDSGRRLLPGSAVDGGSYRRARHRSGSRHRRRCQRGRRPRGRGHAARP